MAGDPQPLRVWHTTVPPEWTDYNRHMSEGWYAIAFCDATDTVLLQFGFDAGYRAEHGTFYTLETRIRYLQEVAEGATIHTASWVLGADAKRIHLLHELSVGDDPAVVATQEAMLLHVAHGADGVPAAAPMLEPVLGAATAQAEAHAGLPLPDHVGQGSRVLR